MSELNWKVWVPACLAIFIFMGIMTLRSEGLFGAILGIFFMVFAYTSQYFYNKLSKKELK